MITISHIEYLRCSNLLGLPPFILSVIFKNIECFDLVEVLFSEVSFSSPSLLQLEHMQAKHERSSININMYLVVNYYHASISLGRLYFIYNV